MADRGISCWTCPTTSRSGSRGSSEILARYERVEKLVLRVKELWWVRMFRLSLSPVWIEERDELMKDYGKIICSM